MLQLARSFQLEGVSLPCGDERPKQGARFCVKDLYDYRGKLVEEILEQSIREKKRFITFNNYQQVCNELAGIDVRINDFAEFKSLDDCIIRRHKIVHEVDKTFRPRAEVSIGLPQSIQKLFRHG